MYLAEHIAKLPVPAERTWLAFYSHANRRSGLSFPGDDVVAQQIGTTARNVQKAKRQLLAAGYLAESVKGGGRGHPSKFHLSLPETPSHADVVYRGDNPVRNSVSNPVSNPVCGGVETTSKTDAKLRLPETGEPVVEPVLTKRTIEQQQNHGNAVAAAGASLLSFLEGTVGYSARDAAAISAEAKGLSLEEAAGVWGKVTGSNVDNRPAFFRTIVRDPDHEILTTVREDLERERAAAQEHQRTRREEAAGIAAGMSVELWESVRGWIIAECRKPGGQGEAAATAYATVTAAECRKAGHPFQTWLTVWVDLPGNREAMKRDVDAVRRLAELQEWYRAIPAAVLPELAKAAPRDTSVPEAQDVPFLEAVVSAWGRREADRRAQERAAENARIVERDRQAREAEKAEKAIAAAECRAREDAQREVKSMDDGALEDLRQRIVASKPPGRERRWWESRRGELLKDPIVQATLWVELHKMRQGQAVNGHPVALGGGA